MSASFSWPPCAAGSRHTVAPAGCSPPRRPVNAGKRLPAREQIGRRGDRRLEPEAAVLNLVHAHGPERGVAVTIDPEVPHVAVVDGSTEQVVEDLAATAIRGRDGVEHHA